MNHTQVFLIVADDSSYINYTARYTEHVEVSHLTKNSIKSNNNKMVMRCPVELSMTMLIINYTARYTEHISVSHLTKNKKLENTVFYIF